MQLIEYLPARHRESELGLFQEAVQPVADELRDAAADFRAQLWPSTATWGLDYWERAFGLTVDAHRDPDWRRSRIIAKIRGGGATTVAAIKNIAESFSNGAADIIEYPGEFRFEVKFTGTVGTPPNMDDLTSAINEVKPAHLTFTYVFIWLTWRSVAQRTWDELASHTWDEVKEGDI